MKKPFLFSALVVATASAGRASGIVGGKAQTMLGLTSPSNSAKLPSDFIATHPPEAVGIVVATGRNLHSRFWAIDGADGFVPNHGHTEQCAVFTVTAGEFEGITSVGVLAHGEQ